MRILEELGVLLKPGEWARRREYRWEWGKVRTGNTSVTVRSTEEKKCERVSLGMGMCP